MKLHLITLLLLMSSLSFGVTTNRVDRIIVLGDSNTADDTVSIYHPNGLTRVWTDILQTYKTNSFIDNVAEAGASAAGQEAILSGLRFSTNSFDVITLMFGANDLSLGLSGAYNGIVNLAIASAERVDRVAIISYYGWRHADLTTRTNIFLLNNLLRGYASSNGMMFIDAALVLNESNSVSSKVEYEIAHAGNTMNHHLNDAGQTVLFNLITNEFVNFTDEPNPGHQFTCFVAGDATITITGYTGTNVNVVIPSSIGGFPVTTIGQSAFYTNTVIESVLIPDTVTVLYNASFYGCSSLKAITIPDSVTTIGNGAFAYCGLETVTIGSGVTFIDNWAFAGCYDLVSIYFKGNAPTLGSGGDGAQHGVFSADTFTSPDSIPATAYVKQGTTGWPPVPSTNVYEYLGRRDFYNIEQDTGDGEYGIPLEYWRPKIYGVMNYSKASGIAVESIKSFIQ